MMLRFSHRSVRILAVLLTAVLLAVCFPVPVRAAESQEVKSVRVAVEDSNVYFVQDENGRLVSGYGYEYIQNIAAYANWKVVYLPFRSFSDCLESVKNGEADLFYDVSYTEERAEWLLYPDVPMGQEEYYLFCLSDNEELQAEDYSTLNGRRVGVTAGTIEEEELRQWCAENGVQFQIISYDSDPEKENALETGEIDMEYEISILAKSSYSALIKISASDFYLVTPKGRQDLINDINSAYTRILNVNRYFAEHLNEKYFSRSVRHMSLSADERAWVNAHDTLRVGYLESYLPFCGTDADGMPTGMVKDLLPELLNGIRLSDAFHIEYESYQSTSALYRALRNGEIDVAFPVHDNIEFATRNRLMTTSSVISFSADLVYTGNYSESTVDTIAVNGNDQLQEYYTRTSYPGAELYYYDDINACLEAVSAGRVGSIILNGMRTSELLENMDNNQLHTVRLTMPLSFSFAVGEGNSALLSILNRAIAGLNEGAAFGYALSYLNQNQNVSPLVAYFQAHKVLMLMIAIIILLTILCISAVSVVMLNRARHKLMEADAAKTSFLFNMSHDIRTPMNAVIGFTNMALDHLNEPEMLKDSLGKIKQSGNILLSLINAVLEVSRIESGKVRLIETPGDVCYCFENIRSTMEELAQTNQVELTFSFGEIRDRFVYADYESTSRVFINIISNAIKYSLPGGRVRVCCEQVGREGDRGVFRYTFADNGIGISEEFQKHLFDEFAREQNTTMSGVQGFGLGLSVVKHYVDQMQGTITCESKQGEGSTFTVILPFRLQEEGTVAHYVDPVTGQTVAVGGEEQETVQDFSGKRVLLVEDNELNREIANYILTDANLTVEEAADGSEAVKLVQEKGADYYDFILMDVQMPVMDGYDATKAIRTMYPDASTPIIALSANAFAEDKAASLQAGMDDHIAKPIDTQELFRVMAQYL